MITTRIFAFLLFAILLAISSTACSKGKSPVEPVIDNVPISFGTESKSRSVLAVYNAVIDPIKKTFTVEPANRTAEYHYPLTQLYPNVLQITNYGWTPNFWADIKITHPLPGSGIDGFDPRVIAILPANPGVSFNYPSLNINANNSIITEPDGYTKLCDWIAPSIPGNANPFIAYFKDQPNRVWSSSGETEETLRWYMDFSGFGGPMSFALAVNVSTNYPNPPQPGTDNAHEPVRFEIEFDEGLTPDGGSAEINVTVLDWQGHDGCVVQVESPDIFNGVVDLTYSEPGPNPNEYIFSGTISNDLHAYEGFHSLLVASTDQASSISIYKETTVHVKEENPFNLVDVTPGYLNILHENNFIDGNYLYMITSATGLHIFNISDPLSPVWVTTVDIPVYAYQAYDVYVSEGYAYVALYEGGLAIIDIDPPESAQIVNSVDLSGNTTNVYVSNGYAYMNCGSDGFEIIDIEPPQSAHIVNFIKTRGACCDICVSGNYAYVGEYFGGFQIYNINPPETAYIVNDIDIPDWVLTVAVSGGYAYAGDWNGVLRIIDVDPPESASIINSLVTPGFAYEVDVSGSYAYVVNNFDGLQIIDIDPPESAFIVNSVETSGTARNVSVSGDYAYIANGENTQIININPPEFAYITGSIESINSPNNVCVSNGYAYVSDYDFGLRIINIEHPEMAYLMNSVKLGNFHNRTRGIDVSGDYAYTFNKDKGLCILNINPPESAYILNTVEILPGYSNNVFLSDGYAYVTTTNTGPGMYICDIDPPESAYLFWSLYDVNDSFDVCVSDGYTYLASVNGLTILDIDIPTSVDTVKHIGISGGTRGVYVSYGYAYAAAPNSGLYIIDIDPPDLANLAKTVDTPGAAMGIYVSGGYAYVADSESGLQIIDIDPVESAYIVESIDTPSSANDVCISDGYAYIADNSGGLRIIDLW